MKNRQKIVPDQKSQTASKIFGILTAIGIMGSCVSSAWADTPNNAEKIQSFLTSQQDKLSTDFPYRINLPKNGQTAQNDAGIRIAENASQLFSDDVGQVFYYDLYDHAMRVPHWHANTSESGVVLEGKMRITIWEGEGKTHIFTVEKNGTWAIPPASLHVLENIGNTNLKFLVTYDVPNSADRDFVTAWAALPEAILEHVLGLTKEELANVPKTTQQRLKLSAFDPNAVATKEELNSPFTNNFSAVNPLYKGELGSVTRIDHKNTPEMKAMSLQQTVLQPGAIREPHWYRKADDLLYLHKGKIFFTMMNDDGKVYNAIITPGDLVFIPKGVFHTYVNVGTEAAEVYEMFNTAKHFNEVSLLSGAQHFSAPTLASAVGISQESAKKLIAKKPLDYIGQF